ncbi:MAG: hypothetical protein MMC23_003844 [Stictis urceolatum]|nr:hypothetical protein [Stictis urceolata]
MYAAMKQLLRLCTLGAAISSVHAWYIPGYSIKTYEDKEEIPLYLNKVYSDNTQLQYPYYDLPFVCPASGDRHAGLISGKSLALNLGEVLRGDRIVTSDYDLVMNQDNECKYLCTQKIDRNGIKRARQLIEDGYVAEWIVDNLPGATSFVTVDRTQKYYAAGFKLGYKDISPLTGKPQYYVNNHVTLVIRWRKAPGKAGEQGGKVIVGFEVYTRSIGSGHRNSTGCPSDIHHTGERLNLYIAPNNTLSAAKYAGSSYIPEQDDVDDGAQLEIPFSYSVYFREDERVEWANRWDMYFKNQEDSNRIHWLAIVNALIICGLLTTIVVMIWNRTVNGDSRAPPIEDGKVRPRRRKNQSGARSPRSPRSSEKTPTGLLDVPGEEEVDSDEESLDDISGWKLLHADVFRTPANAGLLAPLVGFGCQLVFMVTGLLILSCLGVLNPSFRGGFVSVGMGLFVFAGMFSGYFSGRVYKTFNGKNWQKNTLMTATFFPGIIFLAMFILNLFVWAQASSTAMPFGTLLGLAALWLLIQTPLVFAGSWVGFRSRPWEHPTKTSGIPRQIPANSWYSKSIYTILGAGLVPFAVIFIELLFVFRSLWQDKSGYYYVFGFLSVVSLVLIVTVVEVTIVATYIQLCAENYHWWWQSFFIGGSSAIWIFLYCTWFYFMKLNMTGFISGILFFSYSFLACAVYALLTGTVGFLTAYAFVRRIFS